MTFEETPLKDQEEEVTTTNEADGEPVIVSRLEEFYYTAKDCEFEGCTSMAIHHCMDNTLYWGGCGRIFCGAHSRGTKGFSQNGEPLAYICIDCHSAA